MTEQFPKALEALIHELSRLPTIGRKSAQRLAFHLLKADPAQCISLAEALAGLHKGVRLCDRCFYLAEDKYCSICMDARRDTTTICVVEEPADVVAFERSGSYRGLYHVLLGHLSPLHGVMPDDLKIRELVDRVADREAGIKEVILATNPSVDGDATALYLNRVLEKYNIKATRLGLGMPMGGSLEYADELTLQKALEGRRGY